MPRTQTAETGFIFLVSSLTCENPAFVKASTISLPVACAVSSVDNLIVKKVFSILNSPGPRGTQFLVDASTVLVSPDVTGTSVMSGRLGPGMRYTLHCDPFCLRTTEARRHNVTVGHPLHLESLEVLREWNKRTAPLWASH